MDIVLNSRQCELTDRFRGHVEEKLARLEKHDHRVIRVEVEVTKERNPRQADRAVRVQLTAFSKGPVIRAEAAAEDKLAALDQALDKMTAQMRRAADRKRVHRGRRAPMSVGRALADVLPGPDGDSAVTDEAAAERRIGPIAVTGGPDDPRPGAVRDGAGRPRLLPVRGQGQRASVRGLPSPWLRLRGHLTRRDVTTPPGGWTGP
jgi:ribosomal subunit interface protein